MDRDRPVGPAHEPLHHGAAAEAEECRGLVDEIALTQGAVARAVLKDAGDAAVVLAEFVREARGGARAASREFSGPELGHEVAVHIQMGEDGAYGLGQALPASKMAVAGADYMTDPRTQLRWLVIYADSTYGSPCGAWAHEAAAGTY